MPYPTTPSTPPRSRTNRSTSVSAGSASLSHGGMLSRASPRRRAGQREAEEPRGSSHNSREPRKRRRRDQTLLVLRRLILSRWKTLAMVLFVLTLALYHLLHEAERPSLVIPKHPHSPQIYRHLDPSTPLSLRPSTRILHVTKEFGPATMGGLGVMLTALSIAQSESPYLSISVALPHYSYLNLPPRDELIRPFANLSLPIALNPSSEKTTNIRVPVSLLRWTYSPASDFLNADSPTSHSNDSSSSRTIDVYLLGPSDTKPFSAAFRAKDEGDIYSAYKPLKQEWKDLYFATAAAELVAYLGATDEATVFEDNEVLELDVEDELERIEEGRRTAKRRVDVVHLHGATNAMVAHFLRERERLHQHEEAHSRHPAIVYTLHDSLDEVEYSNLVENVKPFLPQSSPSSSLSHLQPYIYRSDTQLFTSALGIDLSDAVTFVSQSIASDIVSGRFRFHLQDLVMPSIWKRASEGRFIGVTNGLDFTDKAKNPFTAPVLVEQGLAFPRVGEDVLASSILRDDRGRLVSFQATKERAKAHLVAHLPHLFTQPDDAYRPWILFIGRYQYNKGCQFFSTILDILSSTSSPQQPQGRLILLGARNNYPFSALQSLAKQYPHHLTLIDDRATPGLQAQWGTHFRMASDFVFVPSLSEAFGLVAAEGLLFGSPVISTGVGGLREFLVPFPQERTESISSSPPSTGNAYLFDLFPSSSSDTPATQGAEEDYSRSAQDVRPSDEQLAPARAELKKQVGRALRDWERWNREDEVEREKFTRRMVATALALKWNRENGPVEEYIRVYDLALTSRRHRLGLPRFIPPPSPLEHDHDDPSRLPSRSHHPPFVPPPRRHLDHPVAVPNVAHGGHDQARGLDGMANLLVDLKKREDEEEAERVRVASSLGGEGGRHGQMLQVVKVWEADDGKAAAAEKARLAVEKKRKQEEAQASKKKKEELRRTLEKVAKKKKVLS